MKKILIATTALVATAGVAAAEVAVSGNGRMGVVYNGSDLNFSSRLRVVFTASGETDGGLQFGGSFRADQSGISDSQSVLPAGFIGGSNNGTAGHVYISGAFGKLAMGDTVSAAEEVIGDLPEIGFQDVAANDITYITGDNAGNPVGGSGFDNTGPNALYTYSNGALTFALSMNDGQATNAGAANIQDYAVGVKYSMDAYSVSLGYEVSDPEVGQSAKHLIVGADATFADTTVKVFYGDGSGAIDGFRQYGIGVTSKFDAITVKGFVRNDRALAGAADVTSWGLGGEYSLGGGASVAGGFSDNDRPNTKVRADFGLKFTF